MIIEKKQLKIFIFLASFTSLMYELILVRLLNFFLSNNSSFMAIPIAIFGLGIGGLFVQKKYNNFDLGIIKKYSKILVSLLVGSLIVMFFTFNFVFNLTIDIAYHPYKDFFKQIFFCFVSTLPFVIWGILLSVIFKLNSEKIGKIYAYDFIGAALGSFGTAILLRFFGLHFAIFVLILLVLLLSVLINKEKAWLLLPNYLVLFLSLILLYQTQIILVEKPQASLLLRNQKGQELASTWNDLSRLSFLELPGEPDDNYRYKIVHDAGASYVNVQKYQSLKPKRDLDQSLYSFPFLINKNPKDILVMFAGIGKDMIIFNEFTEGKANVEGVELDGSILDFIKNPALKDYNLVDFFNLDNIKLHINEGRSFLENTSKKYDLIFVSSNSATSVTRSGHTRRYLDTTEAMQAYLNHLSSNGLLLFASQPVEDKVVIFNKILETNHSIGNKLIWLPDNLIVNPSGFDEKESSVIASNYSNVKKQNDFERLFEDYGNGKIQLADDDRPYQKKLDWENFKLFPSYQELENFYYTSQWIRIFTLIFFIFISTIIFLIFYKKSSGQEKIPAFLFLYFLFTGILYMCAEIGLMGKLDLFVGNPIFAIALVLSVFLLGNGLGSLLFEKYKLKFSIELLFFSTILSLLFSLAFAELFTTYLLSITFILKCLLVIISLFPLSLCLGCFYPWGVYNLAKNNLSSAIPMSYGISTFSSVIGSIYAIVFSIDIGFRNLIYQTALGYLVIAVIFSLYSRNKIKLLNNG